MDDQGSDSHPPDSGVPMLRAVAGPLDPVMEAALADMAERYAAPRAAAAERLRGGQPTVARNLIAALDGFELSPLERHLLTRGGLLEPAVWHALSDRPRMVRERVERALEFVRERFAEFEDCLAERLAAAMPAPAAASEAEPLAKEHVDRPNVASFETDLTPKEATMELYPSLDLTGDPNCDRYLSPNYVASPIVLSAGLTPTTEQLRILSLAVQQWSECDVMGLCRVWTVLNEGLKTGSIELCTPEALFLVCQLRDRASDLHLETGGGAGSIFLPGNPVRAAFNDLMAAARAVLDNGLAKVHGDLFRFATAVSAFRCAIVTGIKAADVLEVGPRVDFCAAVRALVRTDEMIDHYGGCVQASEYTVMAQFESKMDACLVVPGLARLAWLVPAAGALPTSTWPFVTDPETADPKEDEREAPSGAEFLAGITDLQRWSGGLLNVLAAAIEVSMYYPAIEEAERAHQASHPGMIGPNRSASPAVAHLGAQRAS